MKKMHPVNSHDFGPEGMRIIYSTDGSTTVNGHIVKQIGDTKYVVAPGSISPSHANTYVTVTLATTLAQVGALPANTATIQVSPVPVGNSVEHARKIFGRKLLTVEGNTYNWRKTTAVNPGECNVSGDWNTGPDSDGFSDTVNV